MHLWAYPAYKKDSFKAQLVYNLLVKPSHLFNERIQFWAFSWYCEAQNPGYRARERLFSWSMRAKFWLLERKLAATPATRDLNTRPQGFREPTAEEVLRAFEECQPERGDK